METPAVFTGVELESQLLSYGPLSGITLEPFAAVRVRIQPGFQQFVPPLALLSGEVGSIHVELAPPEHEQLFPYGIHQFRFRIGNQELLSPRFLWTSG